MLAFSFMARFHTMHVRVTMYTHDSISYARLQNRLSFLIGRQRSSTDLDTFAAVQNTSSASRKQLRIFRVPPYIISTVVTGGNCEWGGKQLQCFLQKDMECKWRTFFSVVEKTLHTETNWIVYWRDCVCLLASFCFLDLLECLFTTPLAQYSESVLYSLKIFCPSSFWLSSSLLLLLLLLLLEESARQWSC